ncbi:acyl-CoA thioesterase [Maricaulis salignorans]|uniref:Acyl-CoA thioester hydrolase n=1 Tax=Maricaulis salignorans TaxID=144026 RepID=A0A1G9LHY7_9PROT|nr:thioesterase family protein [Maricaulis salignorans]SDL61524.1 acyl-CoA thioester hydrolase [Maricaulis salignorans]
MTEARPRAAYRRWRDLPTRWADNDIYGHINNAAYYGFFDTIVNCFLIEEAGLDIHNGDVIGLVVETGCNYFAPLAYPDRVEGGLRIAKIGRSSVRYEIALFKPGEPEAAAQGHFVHVYVDRETRRPMPLPDAMRTALEAVHA